MIVKHEIREERNDVFSFWENIPTIENGKIVQVETKLEESTVVDLEKRIVDSENQIIELNTKIIELNTKIALDKSKILMINAL